MMRKRNFNLNPAAALARGAESIERGGPVRFGNARYVLISPCRDESQYMRQTLDSVIAQSIRPAKWIIVNDGSSDKTPQILVEYQEKHDWIDVLTKRDRGQRAVGPGVIEAF